MGKFISSAYAFCGSSGVSRVILRLLFSLLCLIPTASHALDIVKVVSASEKDRRNAYHLSILSIALEKTKKDFGPYSVKSTFKWISRDRGLRELEQGERVNVLCVPSRPEWEAKALPIHISILKDLLDYRLLLIDRKNEEMFSKITTYEDLKQLRFGLMAQWTTTKILERLDFKIVTGTYFEGLFGMLMHDRFDAFIRGPLEAHDEYEIHREEYPDMIIEPTLALHLPMPVYFFVSPTTPRLKDRIETGLRRMLADGSFDVIYNRFNNNTTKSALKGRRIIEIPNPLLKEIPLPQ